MNIKKYLNLYNLKKDYLKDINELKILFNNKMIDKKNYLNLFNIYLKNINIIDKYLLDIKYLNKKARKIKVYKNIIN